MSVSLIGKDPLSYMGVEPANPGDFISKDRDPTNDDYDNFYVGDCWLNKTDEKYWMLVKKLSHVATWIQLSGLQIGNGTDGQVLIAGTDGPEWATITSTGGSFTLTPGANSLNIEVSGLTVDTYTTDSGNAAPAASVLQVLGGTNINTAGSSNVVTVNLDNSLTLSGSLNADGSIEVGNGLTVTTGGITAAGDIIFSDLGAGVVISDGSGSLSESVGTDGQLLIGSSSGNAAWATPGSSDGSVVITGGANSLDLVLGGSVTASAYAFFVGSDTDQLDISGDGTVYHIEFDDVLYDNSGSYSTSTYVFTAPVTGYYAIQSTITVQPDEFERGGTEMRLALITTGGTYYGTTMPGRTRLDDFYGPNLAFVLHFENVVAMTAADTAYIAFQSSGGQKKDGIISFGGGSPGAPNYALRFSGYLLTT